MSLLLSSAESKLTVLSNPQKVGTLEKRGAINTQWKERIFVLAENQLAYFRLGESGSHYRGVIPLNGAVVASLPEQGEGVFSVVSPQRTYFLRASAKDEAEQWVVQINHEQRVTADARATAAPQLAAPV